MTRQYEQYLSRGTVKLELGIDENTLRRWLRQGAFPQPVRMCGHWLFWFRLSEVEAWIVNANQLLSSSKVAEYLDAIEVTYGEAASRGSNGWQVTTRQRKETKHD